MTKGADRESILQGFEPNCYGDGNVYRGMRSRDSETKIIYTEEKKEWVGLTDEQYETMAEQYVTNYYFDTLKYAQAIEAVLKEKNNG
jgi:hypothetical protein